MNRQSFMAIYRAELQRILSKKQSLVMFGITAIASMAIATVFTFAVDWIASHPVEGMESGPAPFMGFGVCTNVLSFVLGLYCASAVAREYVDGTVPASLAVVPNRTKLYLARLLSWMSMVFVVTLIARLVMLAIYLQRVPDIGTGILQVVVCAIALSLFVATAFGLASLARRGSLAVLCFLGVDILLPLGLTTLVAVFPSAASIIQAVQEAMPGVALETVTDLGILSGGDIASWMMALAAVVGWAIVSAVLGRIALNRTTGA